MFINIRLYVISVIICSIFISTNYSMDNIDVDLELAIEGTSFLGDAFWNDQDQPNSCCCFPFFYNNPSTVSTNEEKPKLLKEPKVNYATRNNLMPQPLNNHNSFVVAGKDSEALGQAVKIKIPKYKGKNKKKEYRNSDNHSEINKTSSLIKLETDCYNGQNINLMIDGNSQTANNCTGLCQFDAASGGELNPEKIEYDEETDSYYFKDPNPTDINHSIALPINIGNEITILILSASHQVYPFTIKNIFKWLENGEKMDLVSLDDNSISTHWGIHGCLMANDGINTYIGSGVLISFPIPDSLTDECEFYVLTAAHNILKNHNRVVDSISFYPAMYYKNDTPIRLQGKTVAVHREYFDNREDAKEKDLALVKLEVVPEKFSVKTYDIPTFTPEDIKKWKDEKFLTLNVTGYPGDSPFYGRHMVSIKAKFSYINEKDQLCYDGSLHPGKSGGGVWISELIGEEERHTLVAIHTRGTSRSGIANLLTPDIVESIKEWRKILDGQK